MTAVSKDELCLLACEAVSLESGSASEGNTCDLLTVLLHVGHGVCVCMKVKVKVKVKGSISEKQ